MADAIEPTPKQLEACEGWGWIYVEEELKFMKDDLVGWYTADGFERVKDEVK